MEIRQTNRFKKAYKKLHSNQLKEVNDAINDVIKNPIIGEQKKGNLSWLRVFKFKVLGQLTLLGYSFEETGEITLTFVDIGSHENFYRDISRLGGWEGKNKMSDNINEPMEEFKEYV